MEFRERRYVPVAEVARPHGIRGELKLKIYNEGSDLLLRKPPIRLRMPDGSERDAVISSARPSNGSVLAIFAGVADRNAAEAMRSAQILVARDLFPPLDEGEFYASDIEGARALLPSGEEVGRVTGLVSYPTVDVLVIERPTGTLEVPLVGAFVAKVDAERGVVELVTLEGLS